MIERSGANSLATLISVAFTAAVSVLACAIIALAIVIWL